MDLQLVKKGFDFSMRKKKIIISLALFGCSTYGVYKVYNLPCVIRKRRRFAKLMGALISIIEMLSDSAETVSVVSRDLKEFLQSDLDKIPKSLNQLSKIARSDEYYESLIRVSEAVTIGVLRGYHAEKKEGEYENEKSSSSDKIVDKLVSPAGTGFVSVVIGNLAKNLVIGYYSANPPNNRSNSSKSPVWVDLLSNDKSKSVLADCIQTFVSTAVSVYLDKTMNVNFYEEIFSGLTNPNHQPKLTDIMVSVCNGVVETLVKTSHEVLSNPSPNSQIENQESHAMIKSRYGQSNGWVSNVSSTLSVPRNRRFVFDLTGRVTFETVRSIIGFLFQKIYDGLRTSLNVVRQNVLETGLDVIRYIGARSYVIVTICLALYLHVVDTTTTRVLLPA